MKDQDIERLIDAMIPELRVALKDVFAGQAIHIFDCAEGTISQTGHKVKYVCFIAVENAAAVLEGTAKGIDEANRRWTELQKRTA